MPKKTNSFVNRLLMRVLAAAAGAPAMFLACWVSGCIEKSDSDSTASLSTCKEGSSWESCGCPEYVDARPLDIAATASVGRYVNRLCYDETRGELIASSFTTTDSGGSSIPDRYYKTVYNAETLELLSETETDGEVIEGTHCTPNSDEGFLSGDGWYARVEEQTAEGWWEYLLTVGELDFSFNRPLNTAAALTDDTSFRLEIDNTAVARIQNDGTARFYFHAYHGGTLDVLVVDDLSAMAAEPPARDEDGFHTPSFRARVTLLEEEEIFNYYYPSLIVLPAPDDSNADIVIYFTRGTSGIERSDIGAVRVEKTDAGTQVSDLEPLELDSFWGQSGWHNLGIGPDDRLYAQSDVASFSNSLILAIDPEAFTVEETWEIACINAPENGAAVIPWKEGQLVRFGFSSDWEESRLMFIRNGALQAVGEVPFSGSFEPCRLISNEALSLVWTLEQSSGEIAAVRVP